MRLPQQPSWISWKLFVAAAVLAISASGCTSKQDKALEQAKQQAAKTGQPQTVNATDKDGNTVTTVVQPPAPGQTGEVVTTTVTPKNAAASSGSASGSGAQAGPATGSQAAPASGPSGAGAGGQTQASAPAPPPPVDVAAGTQLTIRINERLSAKGSHPGDKFTGQLVSPIRDGYDNIVIPKGAPVTGMVVESEKRGHFKGAATLELRLTSLTLNGKTYPLKTRNVVREKKGKGKRTAGFIGGGTGLGLLLGGIAGGGSGALIGGLAGAGAGTAGAGLTGNKDLVIPAESVVRFTLKDDLEIQPQS
jgi:hypothetical protein